MTEHLAEIQREVTALEHQLAVERAATEAEKRRTLLLQVHKISRYIDRWVEHVGSMGKTKSAFRILLLSCLGINLIRR
jgi:hypothetical protein